MECPGLHCPGCGSGGSPFNIIGILGFAAVGFIAFKVYSWATEPAVEHVFKVGFDVALIALVCLMCSGIVAGTIATVYLIHRKMRPVESHPKMLYSTSVTPEGIEFVDTEEVDGVHIPKELFAPPVYTTTQVILDGMVPVRKKDKFTLRRD